MYKNLYGLKDSVLYLFQNIRWGLEVRVFVKYQVDPFVWYRGKIILLFYFYYCLIFNTSKDKTDIVYTFLKMYF